MRTQILKIDADNPEDAKIKKAAIFLKEGKVVAVPTETVYGLAVNAEDRDAMRRLYEAKKRPKDKKFTIQIADFSQIAGYIDEVSPALQVMLKDFWPGPLTVIVNGKKGKVGLRMPDNKVTLSIIKEAGLPLAVTSANISGRPSVSSAKDVLKIFDKTIELIVDDGRRAKGIESTVVDCTVSPFRILRKGASSERVERFLKLYG